MAKDSILSKIRKWFKKPAQKQVRVRPGEGHRGIAAGDLKERQRRQAAGEQPFSQEEIDKWETLSGNIVEDFVYNEQILYVNSTNVANLTYYHKEKQMLVQYLSGGRYLYSNVSEQEALQVAQAQSKGAVIWDLFRVRGSKTAHKKPFKKLG